MINNPLDIAPHIANAVAHQDAPALIAVHAARLTDIHGSAGADLLAILSDITGEIATHAGLPNVHHVPGGIWTLEETLSPSSVTSIDSSTFTAHDLWKIILDIGYNTGADGEHTVSMYFNDDTSNKYRTRYIDDTGIVIDGAVTDKIKIGSAWRQTTGIHKLLAMLHFLGRAGNHADASIAVIGSVGMGRKPEYNSLVNAYYSAGTTNITKVNFNFGSNATGKIKLYFMDY